MQCQNLSRVDFYFQYNSHWSF